MKLIYPITIFTLFYSRSLGNVVCNAQLGACTPDEVYGLSKEIANAAKKSQGWIRFTSHAPPIVLESGKCNVGIKPNNPIISSQVAVSSLNTAISSILDQCVKRTSTAGGRGQPGEDLAVVGEAGQTFSLTIYQSGSDDNPLTIIHYQSKFAGPGP